MKIPPRIGMTRDSHSVVIAGLRTTASTAPATTRRRHRARCGRGRWQIPIRVRPSPTRIAALKAPRTSANPTSDTTRKIGSRSRAGARACARKPTKIRTVSSFSPAPRRDAEGMDDGENERQLERDPRQLPDRELLGRRLLLRTRASSCHLPLSWILSGRRGGGGSGRGDSNPRLVAPKATPLPTEVLPGSWRVYSHGSRPSRSEAGRKGWYPGTRRKRIATEDRPDLSRKT